jgi:hypothetical protein
MDCIFKSNVNAGSTPFTQQVNQNGSILMKVIPLVTGLVVDDLEIIS